MKNSFIFDVDSTPPAKMSQWSESTDCCDWNGVDCDEAGHVIGLDLSAEPILIGSLENASGLFSLQYLQSLNLGFTLFYGFPMPSSREPISGFSWRLEIPNFNFFQNLTELRELYLDNVDLSGRRTEWCKAMSFLPNLQVLNLSNCLLSDPINHHLANLLSLSVIRLRDNHAVSCQVPEFVANLLNLTTLDLSQCDLHGKFPEKVLQVPTLETLDLSYNSLLQGSLPHFPKNSSLRNLNLKNTSFSGKLPDSIGNLENLASVDVSSCNFTRPIPTSMANLTQLFHLDFSSNHFSDPIPTLRLYMSRNLNYLNLSRRLCETAFFSAANNSLTGIIPESVCKANYFQVLDLSNNDMSGTIPTCLITNSSRTLGVLNLARNHLNGTLSDTVPGGLQILDINGNQLEGMVPKSLVNCNMLQVFNIGNNQISDKFPCWLKNASGLQVLVLRSNKFSGNISCPRNNVSWTQLQIVYLASNNFSGRLSQKWLLTLEEMMDAKPECGFELKHLRYATGSSRFYEVTLSLTIKGLEIMLQKIPNIFTSIDLSRNNFEEQIPEEMGRFVSLYALNLSHNALTGSIPSSFGNLKHIESLDLSTNNLSGKIPAQLASLNFLSVLNLSYNNLVGKIPTSTQLQSFSPTSYEGNKGLYGPPLTNESQARPPELPPSLPPASSGVIDWFFIAMSIGFAVGFGAVVSPLMFSVQVNKWYNDLIYKFIYRRFRV
ncbi:LRRNT 2 domain-containing protein [Citrus sinensis]|uniref:LRRNT 2 domain-containing protein n=1 Tax=Citrus sinensis TaxID=2711 RepID=A0ACB8JDI9_CITSI|nr:LRRNT 2 domain-containing protein [Citrus sinensis]